MNTKKENGKVAEVKKTNGKVAVAETKKVETKKTKEIVKDAFGNRMNTRSSLINEMLSKGAKKEAVTKALMDKFGSKEKVAAGKFKAHLRYLKREGHSVTEKNDTFTLTASKS